MYRLVIQDYPTRMVDIVYDLYAYPQFNNPVDDAVHDTRRPGKRVNLIYFGTDGFVQTRWIFFLPTTLEELREVTRFEFHFSASADFLLRCEEEDVDDCGAA